MARGNAGVMKSLISDVICPWCFIGKRRMEQAIGQFDDEVIVRWLPFQLNPTMPAAGMERRAYRTAKFGSWEKSLALDAQIISTGKLEGITFDFTRVERTPNTLDAHRLIWLAGEHGVQDAVVERLFRGYFTEGKDLGDRAVLAAIASEAGLVRDDVDRFLHGDDGLGAVRAEDERAHRLGVFWRQLRVPSPLVSWRRCCRSCFSWAMCSCGLPARSGKRSRCKRI